MFILLKDIEPVLNEMEITENQKKIMSNDINEGSTEGKLQHCHYSHFDVFKTMLKLCLYVDIFIVGGICRTKSVLFCFCMPVWGLFMCTHLKWTFYLYYC
jgi:hypothetical protein